MMGLPAQEGDLPFLSQPPEAKEQRSSAPLLVGVELSRGLVRRRHARGASLAQSIGVDEGAGRSLWHQPQ